MKILILAEVEVDDAIVGTEDDEIDNFLEGVIYQSYDEDNRLFLHSNVIGDIVGEVKVKFAEIQKQKGRRRA